MKEVYKAELFGGEELVATVVTAVREALEAAFIESHTSQQIQLSCEEALTNTFLHGYQGTGWIAVRCLVSEKEITLILSDKAQAFDPTMVADPDTKGDLEDRPIGGLGIHLIREMMDAFTYRRDEDTNIITFVKKR